MRPMRDGGGPLLICINAPHPPFSYLTEGFLLEFIVWQAKTRTSRRGHQRSEINSWIGVSGDEEGSFAQQRCQDPSSIMVKPHDGGQSATERGAAARL